MLMKDIQEEIFQDFKARALAAGVYPEPRKKRDQRLRHLIGKLVKIYVPQKIQLDRSAYTTAWFFPYKETFNSKAPYNFKIMIIGLNETTGHAVAISRELNLQISLGVTSPILPSPKKTIAADHALNTLTPPDVDEMLSHFNDVINHIAPKTHSPESKRQKLYDLARIAVTEGAVRAREAAVSEIADIIDADTLEFSKSTLKSNDYISTHYKDIASIYNHVRSAPTPQAMSYRMGAINVLAPTGYLYTNTHDFWDMIDRGLPIYQSLAQISKCSIPTIKRIVRQADIFCGYRLGNLASKLDDLDPAYWPTNPDDLFFFKVADQAAEHYAEYFKRKKADVLRQWLKERKNRKDLGWSEIAVSVLENEIEHEMTLYQENWGDKKRPFFQGKTDSFIRTREGGAMRDFFDKCMQSWKNFPRSIQDMKFDIMHRVIRPMAILTGYNEDGALATREQEISEILWRNAQPSEQFSASNYWHSPRVNFRSRFASISQSPDKNMKWACMFGEPTEIISVVLHPLTSRAALADEAEAMQHCVWSYASQCLEKNYHIFSIRDQDGNRLSTLTVQDFEDPKEKLRQIQLIQNRSVRNDRPPKEAREAGEHLIKAVNAGEIKPDWKKVDQFRASFKHDQHLQSIGYDFHNVALRDEIVDLYRPCLPRRIASGLGGFNDLAKRLGITLPEPGI